MVRYAWIIEENGNLIIKDIVDDNPYKLFHPEIAKNYTEIITDDTIRNGAYFDKIKLKWENVHIPITENVPVSLHRIHLGGKIAIPEWKAILAASETNQYIKDFVNTTFEKIFYEGNQQMLLEVLDYLKSLGLISNETISKILERGL